MSEPTVPREVLERVAAGYHELQALQRRQQATQAKLIRACLAKIRQDYKDSREYRMAQGLTASNKVMREHKREQAEAFLHLEWLATQLENASGVLDPDVDLGHVPVIIDTRVTE